MDQRVAAGRSEMRIENCRLKGGHSRHFRPLHLWLFLGDSRTCLESLGQEAAKLWGKGMKVHRRMGKDRREPAHGGCARGEQNRVLAFSAVHTWDTDMHAKPMGLPK